MELRDIPKEEGQATAATTPAKTDVSTPVDEAPVENGQESVS